MENQQTTKSCHGECARCSFQQRIYCASYMARNNYAMMETVLVKLDAMQSEITDLHARINAIQSAEGELIKPFAEEEVNTMGQAV